MNDIVNYENNGAVAVITLNRPDAMNAFTTELSNKLQLALERAADDEARRCPCTVANRSRAVRIPR